jgi:hypothetical protein
MHPIASSILPGEWHLEKQDERSDFWFRFPTVRTRDMTAQSLLFLTISVVVMPARSSLVIDFGE